MKVHEVEREGDKLKIAVEGESTTFAHMIRKQVLQNPNTDVAAAVRRHPYASQPEIIVKTKKGKPDTVLADAADKIAKMCKELRASLK